MQGSIGHACRYPKIHRGTVCEHRQRLWAHCEDAQRTNQRGATIGFCQSLFQGKGARRCVQGFLARCPAEVTVLVLIVHTIVLVQ